MPANDALISAFIDACRLAAEADLMRYSSGNMSCRLDGGLMAVTAKGSWLGRMSRESVSICRIDTGAPEDDCIPSVESGFHAGIYRARPDVNAVLHCQSPFATAIACGACDGLDFNVIPEIPFYVGKPGLVDYKNPGSRELADAVIGAAEKHDLVLLRNHGQVVVGKDLDAVIQKAGFFELACQIILCGQNVRPMPPAGIEALRSRAAKENAARI